MVPAMPPAADSSPLLERVGRLARLTASLRRLPPRVARFYVRALVRARREGDEFSLVSGTRPIELAALIRLARGSTRVAEIGTGAAWTAIALALSERSRRVVSYDSERRPQRAIYLGLVGPDVRNRIELVDGKGEGGPRDGGQFDMVFIDSSHEREETLATFGAWREVLAPGGIMAFHDYQEPLFPGVTEAIRELGLEGEAHGRLFVWRKPSQETP